MQRKLTKRSNLNVLQGFEFTVSVRTPPDGAAEVRPRQGMAAPVERVQLLANVDNDAPLAVRMLHNTRGEESRKATCPGLRAQGLSTMTKCL